MTEQHQEVQQELSLMKEEINTGVGGASVDNVRIRQLEMQNNQLKDAVVKLFYFSILIHLHGINLKFQILI